MNGGTLRQLRLGSTRADCLCYVRRLISWCKSTFAHGSADTSLLYHSSRILLHRPYSALPENRSICRSAANQIEALIRLYKDTFAIAGVTYLMAYCFYTGASAMMQDALAGDMAAKQSMELFLEVLRGAQASCPVLQRSLNIIQSGLAATAQSDMGNQAFLPAFPGLDLSASGLDDLFFHNMGTMDYLDNFPELNMPASSWQ